MKKLVTVFSALLLVGCIAAIFYGCGAKDEEITTTTTKPATTETDTVKATDDSAIEDGKVTDQSEKDENGVIGDVVTDVSEGMSDVVTDVSEDVSDMME